MTAHGNLVAGEWVAGVEANRNVNPSNLDDVVGEYARADAAQANRAIAAAARRPGVGAGNLQERADTLDRIGDTILKRKAELGTLLSREEGKTLPEGIGEAARAGYIFKFFAGEVVRQTGEQVPSVRPGVTIEITREPIGVVGIITPWNFPLAIPAWKIAPALAYGNCVVFKPADLVPACAWALAEIISQAGLPPGVFNLVMGRGAVVGEALLASPDVAGVSFTGSVETGRAVAQKVVGRMGKVQLEMGGKNPLVILDDADLGTAVTCATQGAYFSTGQRCTASSRLIVTQGIHDRFVAAMLERLKALKVDDALRAGHRHRPGRGPEPARSGPALPGGRPEGGRPSGVGRRNPEAAGARLLSLARPVHRLHQRHAHQPRGDLRPGGQRHPRAGLRRGLGRSQRHAFRLVVGRGHHVPEARLALQAELPGGDGDGQPAHRRRGLSCPLRRAQGVVVRAARAGALRRRVLHHREDRLHCAMKRSTERILTTHVGSLARPDALVPILKAKDRGQPYDRDAYTRLVREAVADVVRRQTEAGVDVITDGEQGKASFFGYVVERFTGFERQPAPAGQEGSTRAASREYLDFPDYYAWSERIAEWAGGTRQHPPVRRRRLHGARHLPGPGGGAGRHRQSAGRG